MIVSRQVIVPSPEFPGIPGFKKFFDSLRQGSFFVPSKIITYSVDDGKDGIDVEDIVVAGVRHRFDAYSTQVIGTKTVGFFAAEVDLLVGEIKTSEDVEMFLSWLASLSEERATEEVVSILPLVSDEAADIICNKGFLGAQILKLVSGRRETGGRTI